MNPDEVRGMFMPRKTIPRTNSSSSVSSTSSSSSTATAVSTNGQTNGASMPASGDLSGWPNAAPRKRPQGKGQFPLAREGGTEMGRMPAPRPQMANGVNGVSTIHSPSPVLQSQPQMAPQRPLAEPLGPGQPVLYLLSLNGTFERKTIQVPFFPDTLRIGRQTNAKTVPTPVNGFFDSKVLSRQHAEIWADRQGKIWIRDIKSSNGTFVNGTRLSQENRESEPHELQTQDHLELGIDIVNEDQTSVVHRKVAAKVEHAGFLNPSSNLLDMNFGDLDPANAGMIMPQVGGMQFRGRTGSQASIGSSGRMAPASNMMSTQTNGMHGGQRGFWLAPITTEMIVKKLHQEMRSARLQSHDLGRTGQFINALLSKEDVKNLEKPPVPDPPKAAAPVVNGNGIPFRADAKARFSDPPAPPPQQPLPEKPDVPSLKRGSTERPKSVPSNTSPIRQDNLSQIIQLTEALNNAKREIDTQTAKMRDLEEMLLKEREAREAAEELAKRLEDDAHSRMNGSASSKHDESILEGAFEPPTENSTIRESDAQAGSSDQISAPKVDDNKPSDSLLPQIELMMSEITNLKQQLEAYRQRAETAEAERDADRKSLAEMVLQIRQRDEEAKKIAAETKTRSPSKRRRPSSGTKTATAVQPIKSSDDGSTREEDALEEPAEELTLSRANTITPLTGASGKLAQDQAIAQSLPYASMIGVVLLGMGLMAYINGWQPQPRLDR